MNSFQPFQAWILSAGLHALTLIVLAGPAYEVVAGRKSTACDPPCFLHLPSSESERFFSKLAKLLNWCQAVPHTRVRTSFHFWSQYSLVFQFWGKMWPMENSMGKNCWIFFQTLLCFYCCYSFQTLPFFHRSSHSSLSLLLLQPCVTVSNTASPPPSSMLRHPDSV